MRTGCIKDEVHDVQLLGWIEVNQTVWFIGWAGLNFIIFLLTIYLYTASGKKKHLFHLFTSTLDLLSCVWWSSCWLFWESGSLFEEIFSSVVLPSRRNSTGTCPRMGFFCWRPEIHWFRVASSPWPVIHMAKTGPSLPSDKTENVNYMRYISFPMLLFFQTGQNLSWSLTCANTIMDR